MNDSKQTVIKHQHNELLTVLFVALNIIIITLNPTDPHHCTFKLTQKLHGLWLGLPSSLRMGSGSTP